MTAAASFPAAQNTPKGLTFVQPMSVQEYLASEMASPVKREYLAGKVYAMAGARNVHQMIAAAFLGTMWNRLRGKPCQPFGSDTKVRIRLPSGTRFYYPDGQVVCDPNPPNDIFNDRPVVIAEVVSPSTRRVDQGEKLEAYLAIPTLSAYLIIETLAPVVTVYHRGNDGFVRHVYESLEATVPLEAVGSDLPLAELYERVDFAAARKESDAEQAELQQ